MKTDVVIMGGGLAGLSLARQLKLQIPHINILVLERRKHPAPEAAFKVGESSVEIGAHYYGVILGLKKHLEKDQLFKLGLRFFLSHGDNTDISQRFEMGPTQLPTPLPSYQIDRGRFENYLREINIASGITVIDECRVQNIELNEIDSTQPHLITAKKNNEILKIAARWAIDATGRFGLIKKKLHLEKEVGHKCNASWFRVKSEIDIETWSNDPNWLARSPLRQRRLSTNHLMGAGYWVWLIPLASGSTSVGIVADPRLHPLSEINTFDLALAWLHKYEPQCAKVIEPLRDKVQDFLWLKNFSYGCKQMYSSNRWCLTGEAGAFSDAFYSPGNDFIGIGNCYITDLIVRDNRGESIADRVAAYNHTYLQHFDAILAHYEDMYPHFGNSHVMMQKLLSDNIGAFAIPFLLFFNQKLCDLAFMERVGNKAMAAYHYWNTQVQAHYKKMGNSNLENTLSNCFLNMSDIIRSGYFGPDVYIQLLNQYSDELLIKKLEDNIKLIERIANDILSNKNIAPYWLSEKWKDKNTLWQATLTKWTLAKQNNWAEADTII